MEREVEVACGEVERALRRRRDELLRELREARQQEHHAATPGDAARPARHAARLLQLCLEVLKETDHAAFLQVTLLYDYTLFILFTLLHSD